MYSLEWRTVDVIQINVLEYILRFLVYCFVKNGGKNLPSLHWTIEEV